MSNSKHPESLEDFIHGRLSDSENEAIIKHLLACATCEAAVERLWETVPLEKSHPEVEEPGFQITKESEQSLSRRIHRSELGGQLVRHYTQGFIRLFTGLLHPIVNSFRKPNSPGGNIS